MEKSRLRRTLREQNNLSDDDTFDIERVLREYSEGRLAKREAARRLSEYVPEEKRANLLGLEMDDLLPLVAALLGGAAIGSQGGIGGIIGRFLGNRSGSGRDFDLGGILGNILGNNRASNARDSQSDFDLQGLIGGILGNDSAENKSSSKSERKPRKRK